MNIYPVLFKDKENEKVTYFISKETYSIDNLTEIITNTKIKMKDYGITEWDYEIFCIILKRKFNLIPSNFNNLVVCNEQI